MISFDTFSSYTPDSDETAELVKLGIGFLQTAAGVDWYDAQKQFSADTTKVQYGSDSVICGFSTDASTLFPDGLSVVEVATSDVPAGLANDGAWVYDGTSITARTYTSTELVAQAELTQTNLITSARATMNEWQNDLALGDISDSDKALLTTWNTYVKALKALDLTTAPDITWPDVPSATATTTTASTDDATTADTTTASTDTTSTTTS